MLGYVAGVQRKEIRQGIACVKHKNMAGSDMGDDHKEYFAGDAALKASGKDNTMNQFYGSPKKDSAARSNSPLPAAIESGPYLKRIWAVFYLAPKA